jgi:hypothetical protein
MQLFVLDRLCLDPLLALVAQIHRYLAFVRILSTSCWRYDED